MDIRQMNGSRAKKRPASGRRGAVLATLALPFCLALSAPGAAKPWTYRSLDLDASELRDPAAAEQLAYARAQAGNLTRLRIGESSYYTRLVLDFDDRTRFVVSPVSERSVEITLFKLRPDQVAQQLDPPKGLIGAYRFEPSGEDTRLIVQASVPISISVMGDLAPDDRVGAYRLFFDFVKRGQPLPDPSALRGGIDMAAERPADPTPREAEPRATLPGDSAGEIAAQDEEAPVAFSTDPRDDGVYLRAGGGLVFTANTKDDIATISDDAGNGYKVGAAVGYRPLPFLRTELEGGHFGGLEVENASGSADVDGWYAAVNGFIGLSRELWRLRPYLGAGIGVSRNAVGDSSGGTAPPAGGADETTFLWQLFAGAEIMAVDHLSVDLGYRFAHHGEISSEQAAGGTTYNGSLRAHEVYLGVIYDF